MIYPAESISDNNENEIKFSDNIKRRWSSAQAHLYGVDDTLVKVSPMLERIGDWKAYLSMNDNDVNKVQSIQMHTRTGRPLGSEDFLKHLEIETGLSFMPQKPGPKSSRA